MRKIAHSLAKLTPPRLHRTVDRERLFRLLDGGRERQCVWVCGPPGAGKTTLMASYLSACAASALWYRIDPGDSDPASFFYYLREAAVSRSPRQAKRLPLFTPEYRDDLLSFARRFFRDALKMLGGRFLLIFDNFQELADGSALHQALAACLEEIPPDVNVVMISRADPPPAYARALINGLIARVDWESLRLTREETAIIARSRGISLDQEIAALHEQSCDWMAGLVLMAERLRQTGDLRQVSRTDSLETVFDYFPGQILDTAAPETRHVMLCTGLLPNVTADNADAVTGLSNAIEHVEQLFRRRLFVDRAQGLSVSLLNDPDTIRHRSGRLSINPAKCWVDLLVLTRFSNDQEPPQLASSIELYRGAFLPDDDEGWVLPMREKARAWFLEAVPRHASELEQAGQLDQAARCYASAIAADDTLEPFYQGLISCYERLDRCAEASAVRHHLHQRFATSRSAASALARPSLPRSLRPS